MIFNVYFGSNGKMGKPSKREFGNLDEAIDTVLKNSIMIPFDKSEVQIKKHETQRRAWLEWDYIEEDGSISQDFHYIEDANNSLHGGQKSLFKELEERILREAKEKEKEC